MKNKLFGTPDTWTFIILRILLGLVIFPHGAQKLLGWFGGYGFTGTMNYFTETVGLPWIIGFLVIVIEFFGSIALIAGIGTRIIAASYAVLRVGNNADVSCPEWLFYKLVWQPARGRL